MKIKSVLERLYSLDSSRIKLGLSSIHNLLSKIGNPEKKLRCIHIAGTNGKGSVSSMIFHALREAGFRVGLYTSPHLKKFNERIRINNSEITDEEIVNYFLMIKPFITNQSFFEITTSLAFLYFKEKKVDFVVLEVGLGGRLDATNVATPMICVITNIGLEHTEILGNTIEKIAFEKAGIIKNRVPVVTGAKGPALNVIRKIARDKESRIYLPKKYPSIDFPNLNGQYQQLNKDIALTTIDVMRQLNFISADNKTIARGIRKTRWKGRLEFISKKVLVDCAHNFDGFKVLKKELLKIKMEKKLDRLIFVVGIQKTKDVKSMLKQINPLAACIIFTRSGNDKASEPKELLDAFKELNGEKFNSNRKSFAIHDPKKALLAAKNLAGRNDLVVATGSIYIVGEII